MGCHTSFYHRKNHANSCTEHILLAIGFELSFFEAWLVLTFFLPPLRSRGNQILAFLQLFLASWLQATAIHDHPSLRKDWTGRQLLPPLFHAAIDPPSFDTHLAQDGLYVYCSVLVLDFSDLELELLLWSFVEQILHTVLV